MLLEFQARGKNIVDLGVREAGWERDGGLAIIGRPAAACRGRLRPCGDFLGPEEVDIAMILFYFSKERLLVVERTLIM